MTREVIDSSPDTSLWWAMRGGGGGAFGVVVNSTVKIHKAPEAVSYAQCYYPLNTTAPGSPGYIGPEVLQHYFDTVASTSFSRCVGGWCGQPLFVHTRLKQQV